MSFWPRLRRRSRGRKRTTSAGKANAYSRDIDKYKVVHAESQSQRAQFASDKGVSIDLVRFVSRSSRGWVYFPSETSSPSTNPRSSSSRDEEVTISNAADASHEFSLLAHADFLPTVGAAASRGDGEENTRGVLEAEFSSSVGNDVMGLDVKGGPRRVKRLVVSRNLKDEAWLQISKTAAILFVKVLVFSRALEESTAFAFTVAVVVDIWNRGKGSFHRMFSALATQLLTTLKPYLTLQQRKAATTLVLAAPKPVPQPSAPEQLSLSNAMKVSPLAEDSDAQEIGSSSFAFPVLAKDSGTSSPRFHVHQWEGDSSEIERVAESESVSSVPSPLVESNKLPSTKACHRLKSKLFKSCPSRKGENSSPASELAHSNDASTSSGSSSNGSPARGKGSIKKALFNSEKPGKGGEEECDEVEQPKSPLKGHKKVNRSHELFFFRSPNNNRRKEALVQKDIVVVPVAPSADGMNLSSSHELRFSLRSLGKKKVSRSQEFEASSHLSQVQDLTLPKSTVDRLESLAFPFKVGKVEGHAQQEERRSVPSSPRQSPSKRKSSLSKMMAMEPASEKYSSRGLDSGSSSPRASSAGGSVKGGKSSKTASSSSTSVGSTKATPILAPEELRPGLRRVKTAVPIASEHQGPDFWKSKTPLSRSLPAPLQSTGELGRSQFLNREILGPILLLAVLGFLMLGRIPAIFCMSCFCLLLSHFQRVFQTNFTPQDQEQSKQSPGLSRLQHAFASPVHSTSGNSSNHGSPGHEKSELQSSEYRKRILIEGLLDRGHRRGSIS